MPDGSIRNVYFHNKSSAAGSPRADSNNEKTGSIGKN